MVDAELNDAPSGEFRIGPIPDVSLDEIIENLRACELRIPGGEGARVMTRSAHDGLRIKAEGPGVLGYLVGSDGIEASVSDIEEFVEMTVVPGHELLMHGHHYLTTSRISLSRLLVTWDEGRPVITRQQHIFSSGRIRPLDPEHDWATDMEF